MNKGREFYFSLLRVCCSIVLSSILPRSAAFRVFCIASSLYSSLVDFCTETQKSPCERCELTRFTLSFLEKEFFHFILLRRFKKCHFEVFFALKRKVPFPTASHPGEALRPSWQQLWERALQEHILTTTSSRRASALWRPGETIDRPLTLKELHSPVLQESNTHRLFIKLCWLMDKHAVSADRIINIDKTSCRLLPVHQSREQAQLQGNAKEATTFTVAFQHKPKPTGHVGADRARRQNRRWPASTPASATLARCVIDSSFKS